MDSILRRDPIYANAEDAKISQCLLELRGAVDVEIFRHSWLDRTSYLPESLYESASLRAMATACEARWGDYEAVSRFMSPSLHREMLWMLSDLPSRDLAWCMRQVAWLDGKPSGGRRGR